MNLYTVIIIKIRQSVFWLTHYVIDMGEGEGGEVLPFPFCERGRWAGSLGNHWFRSWLSNVGRDVGTCHPTFLRGGTLTHLVPIQVHFLKPEIKETNTPFFVSVNIQTCVRRYRTKCLKLASLKRQWKGHFVQSKSKFYQNFSACSTRQPMVAFRWGPGKIYVTGVLLSAFPFLNSSPTFWSLM